LIAIIEQSTQLFMKYGIRSLTMDDVAKHLRISKKTLYQYVSDKDDLVNKCIDGACVMDSKAILEIVNRNLGAIDELLEINQFVNQRLNNIHPSIFFDLEKYHRGAMGRFEKHKQEFILNCVSRNIEKGIKEGAYRSDMNPGIIARLYLNTIDTILHGESFRTTEFNIPEIHREAVNYHLHGIASAAGLAYLNQIKNQEPR